MSTRTLTLELDERTALLAAEGLRGEADRRRRVAVKISAELAEAKRTEKADIRTGAMQVVETLADADALAAAAEALSTAWDTGRPKGERKRRRTRAAGEPEPSPGDDDNGGDDDDEHDEDDEAKATQREDGATVLEHDDDPDVAAARALLDPGSAGPPAAVAPV